MTEKKKLLDMSLSELEADRGQMHRVILALQADRGISYIEAYDRLREAADSAEGRGDRTLEGVLKWTYSDPQSVADSVTLLQRRDEAVEAVYEQEAGLVLLEQTNGANQVLLDQPGPGTSPNGEMSARGSAVPPREPAADVGRIVADPVEHERRLMRIRKAQPQTYDGPDGRANFREHDRLHAEAGIDLVRSAERPRELAAARAKADQVGAQLDQAMAAATSEKQRLRSLDAEIAKLEGKRQHVQPRAAEATDMHLRMLDGAAELPAEKQLTREEEGRKLLDQAKERNRLLGRSPNDMVKSLEEIRDGVPLPEPVEPETPSGVHGPSHELHQRVQARLRQLDRPDSDYSDVLQQIIREG